MRIKKTSQYINGGASLSNVYGTSNENGYTQEYINGLVTYSTDEVRVGTWFGKPLYRKGFKGTTSSNGSTEITLGIIEDITNVSGNIKIDNDYKTNFNTSFGTTGNNDCRIVQHINDFIIQTGSVLNGKEYSLCLEYTKTTDTTQNTRSISSNDEVEEPIEEPSNDNER